jgi:hypothetical protein
MRLHGCRRLLWHHFFFWNNVVFGTSACLPHVEVKEALRSLQCSLTRGLILAGAYSQWVNKKRDQNFIRA